ncbi:MAG TPA: hypothetical protein VE093_31470 [Polyangiaceae bacterium]|jgi:hypothetical protein|nr:hypothetical protein [Polyangiaceae bacterium]
MGLRDALLNPEKKAAVIADCGTLIDEEVAGKGGLSGLAVKAAYGAVKGIKPGFIGHVVEKLLPEFTDALDPLWNEGQAKGNPAGHLVENRSRAADALLTVTDAKAKGASGIVKGSYDKLRGSAKKHVEEAVPRLARMIEKHAKG